MPTPLPLSTAEASGFDHEVRERRGPMLSMGVILMGAAVTWVAGAWFAPHWMLSLAAGVGAALLFWAACAYLSLGRRGGGWLMRWDGERLDVRLRSSLNSDLDDGAPIVARIDWDAVEWVREVHSCERLIGAEGAEERVRRGWLEIALREPDDGTLAEVLRHEAQLRGSGRWHAQHVPARLAAPDRLRVLFANSARLTDSSLSVTLDRLGRLVRVAPPHVLAERDGRSLEGDDLDALVLELCETGETLRAMRLLASRQDWDLDRARVFVDSLVGRTAVA